ncbi:MAG: hypothetical protein A4E67_01162 [Syntrophaceae bacterium PtaB.Bin038]|nr:MAG: hypothetical protein A4E67_01162 [Syntrophaceae bacterium PtaB.Bin038]
MLLPMPMTKTRKPASARALAASTDSRRRLYWSAWVSEPEPPQLIVSAPSETRMTNFWRQLW